MAMETSERLANAKWLGFWCRRTGIGARQPFPRFPDSPIHFT